MTDTFMSSEPDAGSPAGTPDTAREDAFARQLRGFGPVGILAAFVIMAGNLLFTPLSAILVLVWRWRSHTPWRDIGYVRPRSWIGGLLAGIAFGVLFKLLMKSVVMPLLGAPPINEAYTHLQGNTAALPFMLLYMLLGAGVAEETVWRGYMFERLGKLLGPGAGAKVAIVLLTGTLFGLAHYPGQGLPGAQQAMIGGLVLGALYAVTGRLWMLMCTHAAFDVTALALIYWRLEAAVAHWFFP